MYTRKCSYPQVTVYMDCLNRYKIPFEWCIDEKNGWGGHYIKIKSVEPGNIHSVCHTFLPKKDIDWDEYSSDLYIRVTEESKKIIAELQPKSLLSTFTHNIEPDLWYDLPFCKDSRLGSGITLVGYVNK